MQFKRTLDRKCHLEILWHFETCWTTYRGTDYRSVASLKRWKRCKYTHYKCSRPEVFCKKRCSWNFTKFTEKHLCQSLFFNKVARLRPATLLNKMIWHRCLPVNSVTASAITFNLLFREHLGQEKCFGPTETEALALLWIVFRNLI